MKILAFMQNPWFRPGTPQSWIERYRDDQEFHKRVLARSMSGGRLLGAFGFDLYGRIHWDNVNWRAAEESSGLLDPDHEHIHNVIDRVGPGLIICFGRVALAALTDMDPAVPVWGCHHPNARGKTQDDLNRFAKMVMEFEKSHNETTDHIRTTWNRQDDRAAQHS